MTLFVIGVECGEITGETPVPRNAEPPVNDRRFLK
jgi:hypothetical protein